MTETIGFIGLGAMGGGMAANIVKAGIKVVAYDILPERVTALTDLGAETANSPKAVAAASDRTITMVETTAQTEAVIFGEEGIVQTANSGHQIAMMSTIDPVATTPSVTNARCSREAARPGRRPSRRPRC